MVDGGGGKKFKIKYESVLKLDGLMVSKEGDCGCILGGVNV